MTNSDNCFLKLRIVKIIPDQTACSQNRCCLILKTRRKYLYLSAEKRHQVSFHVFDGWFKDQVARQGKSTEQENCFRVSMYNRLRQFHS